MEKEAWVSMLVGCLRGVMMNSSEHLLTCTAPLQVPLMGRQPCLDKVGDGGGPNMQKGCWQAFVL